MRRSKVSASNLAKASAIIRRGGVVAFPTETVYGLGADALNEKAVKKIFRLKGRPSDNPLIVHIAEKTDVGKLVQSIPQIAERLIDKFWPGPLTLVLFKNPSVPDATTAGLETIAIRMPDHEIARRLIKLSGAPIAAPSANRSGRPSPTSARMVRGDFGDAVFVLDGGRAKIGLESTVLDCTGPRPVILRPGAVTKAMIEKATGLKVAARKAATLKHRSPGNRYRHYAPEAAVFVMKNHAAAKKRASTLIQRGLRVGLASGGKNSPAGAIHFRLPKSHAGRARELYAILKAADEKQLDALVIEGVEKKNLGEAIMDRLSKAAKR